MKTRDVNICTFTTQSLATLQEKLRDINMEAHEWTRLSKCLQAASDAVRQLRTFTCGYKFKDKAEEIRFFKNEKPELVAQYLFYQQLVQLKGDAPPGNAEDLLKYYRQHLIQLQQADNQHASFHVYCLSGSTERDEEYFIRSHIAADPLSDERFTTAYDMLRAQWLAHELLRDHLITAIQKGNVDTTAQLAWTAPKVALIELLYSLHACQVFNNGKADLRHIANTLETVFNVNLGNYYRTLLEIRLRKNNRTTFLDQLKEKFTQRLEDMD